MFRRLRALASDAGAGGLLVAQAVNLLVIAVPIVAGRSDQVTVFVFVSAIAGVAAHTFTLNFFSVFPGLRDRRERVAIARFAVIAVVTVGVLLVVLGALSPLIEVSPNLGYSLGALFVAQSLYVLATTVLIAQSHMRQFARVRIIYAFVNLATTLIAVAVEGFVYGLAYATALSFGVAGAVAGYGQLREWVIALASSRGGVSAFRRFWRAALAACVGGVAGQAPSMFVPLLGEFAAVWATSIRVVSGFSTVAQFVAGPAFDARFGQAVRERHVAAQRVIQVRALALGGVLGLLAAVGSVVAIRVAGVGESDQVAALFSSLAVAVYAIGAIIPAVGAKFLVMRGDQAAQMILAMTKLIAIAIVLLVARALDLLVAFAAIELMTAVAISMLLMGGSALRKRFRPE